MCGGWICILPTWRSAALQRKKHVWFQETAAERYSPPPSCPSAEESIGGGDKSNHGRKKRLMGHVR